MSEVVRSKFEAFVPAAEIRPPPKFLVSHAGLIDSLFHYSKGRGSQMRSAAHTDFIERLLTDCRYRKISLTSSRDIHRHIHM